MDQTFAGWRLLALTVGLPFIWRLRAGFANSALNSWSFCALTYLVCLRAAAANANMTAVGRNVWRGGWTDCQPAGWRAEN